MKIVNLIDAGIFELKNAGDTEKDIEKVFCCDLLSVAMSKAGDGAAWVTVMANANSLAVATLTDAACIVLAEGMQFDESLMAKAREQEITVFETELPVFEAALRIHELLEKK